MKISTQIRRPLTVALRTVVAVSVFTAGSFLSGNALADTSVHDHINTLIQKSSTVSGQTMTNADVKAIFLRDHLGEQLKGYPVGNLADGFVWKPGMGTTFVGKYSKLKITDPFTAYMPLPEGPVLNPKKTYRIGFVFHGFNQPWLVSLADTAAWEAARHPNVKLDVVDAQFDDNRMAQVIDSWITKKYDGIVLWPMDEAPMGPPVDRAIKAGIPVVSVDRRTSSKTITSEVTGNFYANGLQQGLYLNNATGGHGNIILLRKALGSTADSIRAGSFLQAIGNEPGYHILANYQVNDDRTLSFKTMADALQRFKNISVVYAAGGEQAMGALEAIQEAKRLYSAPGGKKIVIVADDDSKEVMQQIKAGNIDMDAPYTPDLGDLGLRVLIKAIGAKEGLNQAPPKLVLTPNLPMVTKTKMNIDGIETVTPDEWLYAYGPDKTK